MIVMIGLGWVLMKSLYKPFEKYGSQFFTSTIACALEYGQLPTNIQSEEGCDASYQAQGQGSSSGSRRGGPGSGGSQGKGATDGSSKEGGGNGGKNGDDAKGKGSGSNSKSSSSGGGSDVDGGSSNNNGSYGGGGGNRKAPTASKIVTPKGVKTIDSTSSEVASGSGIDYSVNDNRSFGAGRRRRIYRPITGAMEEEVEAVQKKDKPKEIKAPVAASSGAVIGTGKKPFFKGTNAPEKKKIESTDQKIDLSRLIRIALIILMIVAIVLFIFFQVSQIRKGGEG